MPDLEGRAPLAAAPAGSRWRGGIRDFNRRPLLFRQVVFLGVFLVLALPVWYYTFHGDPYNLTFSSGGHNDYWDAPTYDYSLTESLTGHPQAATQATNTSPSHLRHGSIPGHSPHHANWPQLADTDATLEHDSRPAESHHSTEELEKLYDPMTFALIMWGLDSAAEGAILLKVRNRITIQEKRCLSSSPVNTHVHIWPYPLSYHMR